MSWDCKRWDGQMSWNFETCDADLGDLEFDNFLARRFVLWSWAVLWTRGDGGWLLIKMTIWWFMMINRNTKTNINTNTKTNTKTDTHTQIRRNTKYTIAKRSECKKSNVAVPPPRFLGAKVCLRKNWYLGFRRSVLRFKKKENHQNLILEMMGQ